MGFRDLASKFAGKTLDLMTEDTIQMKEDESELFILLIDSSDQNFLDYTSAFVRLHNKDKLTGRKYNDFMRAFARCFEKRPSKIQEQAINILKGLK